MRPLVPHHFPCVITPLPFHPNSIPHLPPYLSFPFSHPGPRTTNLFPTGCPLPSDPPPSLYPTMASVLTPLWRHALRTPAVTGVPSLAARLGAATATGFPLSPFPPGAAAGASAGESVDAAVAGGCRAASKKAKSSSRNGRDSAGRRLGPKVVDGQLVAAGTILVRQRGLKFRAAEAVGVGRDHTLFALEAGCVSFFQATRVGAGGLTAQYPAKRVYVRVAAVPEGRAVPERLRGALGR